jgi:uncharacterized protein (TIGR02246 family)
MQARVFFPAGIALAFLLAGCASAPPPTPAPDTRDADAAALRQLEKDWMQTWSTKDINKITAFYADDASVFIPGTPLASDKASIANAFKPFLGDKNFAGVLSTDKVVVAKSGDLAYTQGSNNFTFTDPKTKKVVSQKSKYVTVYMKQADGSWKAVADIFNVDGPPTPLKK